jgi:hypothetical protein
MWQHRCRRTDCRRAVQRSGRPQRRCNMINVISFVSFVISRHLRLDRALFAGGSTVSVGDGVARRGLLIPPRALIPSTGDLQGSNPTLAAQFQTHRTTSYSVARPARWMAVP